MRRTLTQITGDPGDPFVKTARRLSVVTGAEERSAAVRRLYGYLDPRAVDPLIQLVGSSREAEATRAAAAFGLGRLLAVKAAPSLRQAAQSRESSLRTMARIALKRLCPASTTGRHTYVHIGNLKSSGPSGALAARLMRLHLRRLLGGLPGVLASWPGCQTPTAAALKRRKLKGLSVDGLVTVANKGGKASLHVSLMILSYPGKAIRASLGRKAQVAGTPDGPLLRQLAPAVGQAMHGALHRFLGGSKWGG